MDGRASRNLQPFDDGWMAEAACRDAPSEWFFPKLDYFHEDHYAQGREVCAACPVRAKCLALAFELGARDGLWGGKSPRERDRLRRERRKTRARTVGA